MKCADCGEVLPMAKLIQITVRITEPLEEDVGWAEDMLLCNDCHEAFDASDVIGALPPVIIAELRKARQPCCKTRLRKENDRGT